MKSDKLITYITTLASILTLASFIITLLVPDASLSRFILLFTVVVLGIALVSVFGYFSIKPTTKRISLIGAPQAGKSVFLTVLFNELAVNKHHNKFISFQPYGYETVQITNKNFSSLMDSEWLPRTKYNESFHYSAKAVLNRKIFKRIIKLEIGDYAGEHLNEFDDTEESFSKRTTFYKHVLSSDGILIAIDSNDFKRFPNSKLESQLVSTLQIFLDEAGVEPNQMSRIPISVLFLKIDEIISVRNFSEYAEEELKEKLKLEIERLSNLIEKRFRYNSWHVISSVGELKNGMPQNIKPINIEKPILWMLNRL